MGSDRVPWCRCPEARSYNGPLPAQDYRGVGRLTHPPWLGLGTNARASQGHRPVILLDVVRVSPRFICNIKSQARHASLYTVLPVGMTRSLNGVPVCTRIRTSEGRT